MLWLALTPEMPGVALLIVSCCVATVRPLAALVIVGVPAAVSLYRKRAELEPLRIFVLVMVVAPLALKKVPPEELLVKLTAIVPLFVLGLPRESCRCTVIVLEAMPAVVVTGELVNTSLLALKAVILNEPLVTEVN